MCYGGALWEQVEFIHLMSTPAHTPIIPPNPCLISEMQYWYSWVSLHTSITEDRDPTEHHVGMHGVA